MKRRLEPVGHQLLLALVDAAPQLRQRRRESNREVAPLHPLMRQYGISYVAVGHEINRVVCFGVPRFVNSSSKRIVKVVF